MIASASFGTYHDVNAIVGVIISIIIITTTLTFDVAEIRRHGLSERPRVAKHPADDISRVAPPAVVTDASPATIVEHQHIPCPWCLSSLQTHRPFDNAVSNRPANKQRQSHCPDPHVRLCEQTEEPGCPHIAAGENVERPSR